MAFSDNRKLRQTNLTDVLPMIGQPALDIAENSWKKTTYDDSFTLDELDKQREKIYSYGGYAIFDTGYQDNFDHMEARNKRAVHIAGESQAYNPFRFGTSWVVEFDDGYTGVAYFDELLEIDSQDSIDYFGKSLMFDMRGSIYSIASKIANGEIAECDQSDAIANEFDKLYLSKKKLFSEMVEKVSKDLADKPTEEWSEFKKISGYDRDLFKKVSEKVNASVYAKDEPRNK